MSILSPDEVRARGIALPADDGAAQDIIDEQEAWLALKLGGPLTGERTEHLYVGYGETVEPLLLKRYTDSADLTDGGVTIDTTFWRLVANGSGVARTIYAYSPAWTGPYVDVTYTPNDEVLVRSTIASLCALSAPPSANSMEQIGSYLYQRGGRTDTPASRAALISALIPKRDQLLTVKSPPEPHGSAEVRL